MKRSWMILVALVVLTLMAGFQPDAQLEAQALAARVIVALIKMAVLVAVVLLAARYVLPRPFACFRRVAHADRLHLDGDAPLPFQFHGIEHLLAHLALLYRAGNQKTGK